MKSLRVVTVVPSHRYWYFVNKPEIGVRWKQGWTFGPDALAAATRAVKYLGSPTGLRATDVKVTHDTACSCIPEDQRWY